MALTISWGVLRFLARMPPEPEAMRVTLLLTLKPWSGGKEKRREEEGRRQVSAVSCGCQLCHAMPAVDRWQEGE